MKTAFLAVLVVGSGLGLGVLSGCSRKLPSNPSVLVDKTVSVGAKGGYGNVTFNASKGQKVRITLTAARKTMEPYGNLGNPDGTGGYFPPNGGSKDGVNTGEMTLSQTGQFTLTVFDGSNEGGNVHVVIQKQ
jgi:hypothetical protein